MDDGSNTEAERWLNAAAELFSSGDFHGTRTFVIRARESAPVLAHQILAVTDTLLTAQANPRDWYGILQLVPLTQSVEVVENHAFWFVSEAWNVLLNPSKKLVYDDELRFLQFGHVNYSAGSNWTRQINQTGLTHPSQIIQTGSVRANHISWPEPTRSSQTNRSEPIGSSQIDQTEYSRIEPTQSGQINHSATPAPTKEDSRTQTEPTGATRASQATQSEVPENNSTPASQSTQSEGSTFWTACPHCYSRFEYPKVYENRPLRCQTKDCRKSFQAVDTVSTSSDRAKWSDSEYLFDSS
ncbi:uncharacterized protein LOC120178623 [Hibiscus syriacus]|uniref:uncharacterized protein LOC120178623 n=1 Tax=Hibiscus syriacus TaxID=106335 RepID=UPI001921FA25|nr:uncharacterized protein LOC120178623 [Hibiscus syriacus]